MGSGPGGRLWGAGAGGPGAANQSRRAFDGSAAGAKREETEKQRDALLKDLEKSSSDEASLRESLKTARASLVTSEASATALRESERMLTAAVETNAEELKDLRKQLEDMRVDRDKEKTSAIERRIASPIRYGGWAYIHFRGLSCRQRGG